MVIGDANGVSITTRQYLRFAAPATAVDWTDGMNHVLRRQASASGDDGFPRRELSDFGHDSFTFPHNGRAAGAVDCAIHTTATHQGRVCRVDDGIGCFFGDVGRAVKLNHFCGVEYQPDCEVAHFSLSASTPGSL